MSGDIDKRRRRKRLRNLLRGPRVLAKSLAAPLRQSLRPPDYGHLLKNVNRLDLNTRALLRARFPELAADTDQRTLLRQSEFSVYSQNGEDGILLALFSLLGATDHRFIEFGIGNPLESNTTNLALNFGWSGMLIDFGPQQVAAAEKLYSECENPGRVRVVRSLITPQNINEVFASNGFEGEIDLLSLDIDGNDYWVWEAIQVVQPRVVVIEYNACFGPTATCSTVYDERFDRYAQHELGWYHGASLGAMAKLGRAKGYVLAGCDSTGFNAFFVRDDVAKDKLVSLDAQIAFYPDARRTRIASLEDQMRDLARLESVEV